MLIFPWQKPQLADESDERLIGRKINMISISTINMLKHAHIWIYRGKSQVEHVVNQGAMAFFIYTRSQYSISSLLAGASKVSSIPHGSRVVS